MDPLVSMAFMTGLFSSMHCVSMCGGLIGALSLTEDGKNSGILFHLFYNLGRVTSYSVIGFSAGWLGSTLLIKESLYELTLPLLIGSDIFIILIGLGSAGLFRKLNIGILKVNTPLSAINRATLKLHKLPAPIAALSFGLLFGLLPCGLLYAMALTAAQSADAWTGSMMLASFGLGTVPALFLVGHTTQWLSSRRNWMLKGVGVMVALIGCYNLLRHIKTLL